MSTTHRASRSLPGRDLWSRGTSRTSRSGALPIVIPAPTVEERTVPRTPRTVELPARLRDGLRDGRSLRDLGELYDR